MWINAPIDPPDHRYRPNPRGYSPSVTNTSTATDIRRDDLRQFYIMQSVFSAASRRTTSTERWRKEGRGGALKMLCILAVISLPLRCLPHARPSILAHLSTKYSTALLFTRSLWTQDVANTTSLHRRTSALASGLTPIRQNFHLVRPDQWPPQTPLQFPPP